MVMSLQQDIALAHQLYPIIVGTSKLFHFTVAGTVEHKEKPVALGLLSTIVVNDFDKVDCSKGL
jgi:hypothetical protein